MTHEDAIAAILAREQEKGVVTEAELRQQLADVTNERDGLRNQCAGIYQQLQICQKQRDNRQDRLKASEARNNKIERALYMAKELLTTISVNGQAMTPRDWCGHFKAEVADIIKRLESLTQSAPATAPEYNDPAYNSESDARNSAELLQEVLDWFDDGVGRSDGEYKLLKKIRDWLNPPEPATDEQGAKADHGLLQGIVDLKDMKP